MRNLDLAVLGVTEIGGADVWGGEIFPWGAVAAGILIAAGTAVMRDWEDFKAGFSSGYSAGSSGAW